MADIDIPQWLNDLMGSASEAEQQFKLGQKRDAIETLDTMKSDADTISEAISKQVDWDEVPK